MSLPLTRRIGTLDAVLLGLGSMIGAGVFAAFGPAAGSAGSALLVALAVAALVAYANAVASAQLAAALPTSGGTYVYGRELLGPWWGFVAGWGFVVGKTASCAAMALTFAAYVAPASWQRPVAAAAVVGAVGLGYRGIHRTARATRVLVLVVLAALSVGVGASLAGGSPDLARVAPFPLPASGWTGVLQAAGLLFFAFAGYARLATLAEEVKDPQRTIGRAIRISLGITVVVYAVVGATLLSVLGAEGTAAAPAPLSAAVALTGSRPAGVVIAVGAAAASLGALLALLAGVSRTGLAMARERDLPGWLAAVHPRHRVPHHAELAVGASVVVLVLTVDLCGAIGASSAGVLVYYLVANLAAWRQGPAERRAHRVWQVVGALGCVTLVATLPVGALAVALTVLAVGAAGRAVALRRRGVTEGGRDGHG